MLKKLLRLMLTLIGGLFGYAVYKSLMSLWANSDFMPYYEMSANEEIGIILFFVSIFAFTFFIITPELRKKSQLAADNIELELKGVSSNVLFSGTVGLTAGLLIAYLISQIFNVFQNSWIIIGLNIIVYIFFGYIGTVIGTKKGGDLMNFVAERRSGGGVARSKEKAVQSIAPKVLDTSVIIDGRIAEVIRTGFIEGRIIIPDFVLVELRHIADSSDALKRQRGRRGLDILNRIQMDNGIEIFETSSEKSLNGIKEVDLKLLRLAQNMNGNVVTNDYNLNKVAVIQNVKVLNINELANTLKPAVLPGEEMQLFLVKAGKEANQAVAYLDDGTMIVVEDGKKHIGNTVKVIVTSVLQTSAGRMIFAKGKK